MNLLHIKYFKNLLFPFILNVRISSFFRQENLISVNNNTRAH